MGTSGEDINVEEVWDGGNLGEGVNIAIVDDSLFSEHEDLKDNVDTSKNRDYTYRDNVFERHFFHGTYIAGSHCRTGQQHWRTRSGAPGHNLQLQLPS